MDMDVKGVEGPFCPETRLVETPPLLEDVRACAKQAASPLRVQLITTKTDKDGPRRA